MSKHSKAGESVTGRARRRAAALMTAVGIAAVLFSIVLGTGNVTFSPWHKIGAAIGFVAIVGGTVWFSRPQHSILGATIMALLVLGLGFFIAISIYPCPACVDPSRPENNDACSSEFNPREDREFYTGCSEL